MTGMPQRAPTHSEQQGRQQADAAYQQQGRWKTEKSVYKTARWKKLRALVLREEPLCQDIYGWHAEDRRLVMSIQIDHKLPLRVALELAYERSNLQGLCGRCHAKKTHEDLRRYPVCRE